MQAIQRLYLTTQDGRTLGLDVSRQLPEDGSSLHLYREISPVSLLVVSSHGPNDFHKLIVKSPASLVKLPSVCFTELRLGNLADDPQYGEVGDLPYKNMEHLRSCLLSMKTKSVMTKMVDRLPCGDIPFRTIKNGFFVGNQKEILFFPLPDEKELVNKHYQWWRSATM